MCTSDRALWVKVRDVTKEQTENTTICIALYTQRSASEAASRRKSQKVGSNLEVVVENRVARRKSPKDLLQNAVEMCRLIRDLGTLCRLSFCVCFLAVYIETTPCVSFRVSVFAVIGAKKISHLQFAELDLIEDNDRPSHKLNCVSKMVNMTTFFGMSLGAFVFWQSMDKVHVWIALHQDEKKERMEKEAEIRRVREELIQENKERDPIA
ncbi:hypothetical protein LXL04_011635 [Taraxacum kok-saghyz]